MGGLAGPQILEEVADKEEVTFFQGCCNFHIENKLKSVNLMTKKVYNTQKFFSFITKNSKWEILTKNFTYF